MWFDPRSPEDRAPGTLDLKAEDRPVLTLYQKTPKSNFVVPVILGQTIGGPGVTLTDCYALGSQGPIGKNLSIAQLSPSLVLIGETVEKKEDIAYAAASFQLTALGPWLGTSGITWKGMERIEYTRPPSIDLRLPDATVSIYRGLSGSYGQHEVTLKEEAAVHVTTEHRLSPGDWYRHFIRPFALLLSLATLIPTRHSALVFETGDPEGDNFHTINVVDSHLFPKSVGRDIPHPTEMRFIYDDVSSSFEALVNNWFRFFRDSHNVVNTYFSAVHSPHTHEEGKFAAIVESLEGFHRATRDNHEMPDDQHEERIQSIISAAPQEYRQWLTDRLLYSNALSLRRRLRDIVETTGEATRPFLTDERAFINKVVSTRNDFAHGIPHQRSESVAPEKLWEYSFVLSVAMDACLLGVVFADQQRACRAVASTQEYLFQKGRIQLP